MILQLTQGRYLLNTCIEQPHGRSPITSLSFNSLGGADGRLCLVTTGEDLCTKLWKWQVAHSKAQDDTDGSLKFLGLFQADPFNSPLNSLLV